MVTQRQVLHIDRYTHTYIYTHTHLHYTAFFTQCIGQKDVGPNIWAAIEMRSTGASAILVPCSLDDTPHAHIYITYTHNSILSLSLILRSRAHVVDLRHLYDRFKICDRLYHAVRAYERALDTSGGLPDFYESVAQIRALGAVERGP